MAGRRQGGETARSNTKRCATKPFAARMHKPLTAKRRCNRRFPNFQCPKRLDPRFVARICRAICQGFAWGALADALRDGRGRRHRNVTMPQFPFFKKTDELAKSGQSARNGRSVAPPTQRRQLRGRPSNRRWRRIQGVGILTVGLSKSLDNSTLTEGCRLNFCAQGETYFVGVFCRSVSG